MIPTIRNARALSFAIRWRPIDAPGKASNHADIELRIDDTRIWPSGQVDDSFAWFADELLAHLTEYWKALVLQQTYPGSLQPPYPSALRHEANISSVSASQEIARKLAQEVDDFETAHNLASAFGGISGIPSLWLVREEMAMVVEPEGRNPYRVPLSGAITALNNVGDEICVRLRDSGDSRWSAIIAAWESRNGGDSVRIQSFAIGQDLETTRALIHDRFLASPNSVIDASNDNDELKIAARMSGILTIAEIEAILREVRSCGLRQTDTLDRLSQEALDFADDDRTDSLIHEAGIRAAKWLRQKLVLRPVDISDPFKFLADHNVDVRERSLNSPEVDAIACWGPRHGPAIIINRTSRRHKTPYTGPMARAGAIRATAAHEICHLLFDRGHTLPAAEVLGGRVAHWVEQRARAFAAAFLLLPSVAADKWHAHGRPMDEEGVNKALTALCARYQVTKSIAAWQLEHGLGSEVNPQLKRILDRVAPNRYAALP
ncbi:MAG: ImmA/IrrE family metallo-endopeptidase [Proteobacteria bacterium]|nr:ImmA/IrrE family metallo-endopeptidase [Pseudomonadota bacterium]MBI3498350.1 ImmA/IrrE family metallo-endopeptidase [Pseudomonadota bacterium]